MEKGKYTVKDSGKKEFYPSGMRRDTNSGKPRYDLIPLFMLKRIAEHYSNGAIKYGDNNWQLANSPEELNRFKESAFRHFIQWFSGEQDEDHASAVFFNVASAEYVKNRMEATQ